MIQGQIIKKEFSTVQSVAPDALERLTKATKRRNSYEEQYTTFRKLLPAGSKDIPLSEIVDCIDKVIVDGGGQVMVKWDIS